MILKVISGGQTGADQAGLRAARRFGIATGGWLPLGCRTLEGNRRDLMPLYGMQEHPKASYVFRTVCNVRDADATIRFAEDFKSPGELCTFRAIRNIKRPFFDVPITPLGGTVAVKDVAAWINARHVRILNVAGNSEQTAPGIGKKVEEYLVRAFLALGLREVPR